jgi:hypothetical protein
MAGGRETPKAVTNTVEIMKEGRIHTEWTFWMSIIDVLYNLRFSSRLKIECINKENRKAKESFQVEILEF